MKDVKGFLIDLDGVLYIGDAPVQGAHETLELLRKKHYQFRFVSNTTRKSRRTIVERMAKMGFLIQEEDIFSPPIAAREYMKNTRKKPCCLLVTKDVERDFEAGGTFSDRHGIECVVIGDAGDRITYESLNAAFRHLMNGAELIALEKDRYWMSPDGLSLSAGPFVSALEFATGKSATVIGKPSKTFFDAALKDMHLQPDQVAMIGDDIITDIGGANDAGMKSILVRTGKYRKDTLNNSGIKPSYIIESFAHLVELL